MANFSRVVKFLSLFQIILLSFLSGCNYITGGSDNSKPPTALKKIEPQKKFTQLWNKKVGTGTNKQYLKLKPLIVKNQIITIDANGTLQVRDNHNGNLQWTNHLKTEITQGVAGNDKLWLVSTTKGELLALSPKDGSLLWRSNLTKNILSNPLILNNEIYLQVTDGTFYSIDASNGKVNWQYQMLVPDLTLYASSSPVAWQDLIIAGFASGKIVAFDKNSGLPSWEYQIADPSGYSIINRMVDINAEPLITGDTLYIVTYQGKIKSLDLKTGNEKWQRKFSAINNIAKDNRYLYITDSEGLVWALNRNNGRVLWKQQNLAQRDLSGVDYYNSSVIFGDFEGYIHALSTEHGGFIARTKLSNSGIRVAPQVKDGIIYILDNSGVLAAYKLEQIA